MEAAFFCPTRYRARVARCVKAAEAMVCRCARHGRLWRLSIACHEVLRSRKENPMPLMQDLARRVPVLLLGLLCTAGLVRASQAQAVDDPSGRTARAVLRACESPATCVGAAYLQERSSAEGVKVVDVFVEISRGLAPGTHAVHIHETGQCEPCAAAGGHFDPGPNGNPSPDGNHPFHTGD